MSEAMTLFSQALEQLRLAGVDPVGGTPEQLAQALNSETARVTDAAGRAQLKAE